MGYFTRSCSRAHIYVPQTELSGNNAINLNQLRNVGYTISENIFMYSTIGHIYDMYMYSTIGHTYDMYMYSTIGHTYDNICICIVL